MELKEILTGAVILVISGTASFQDVKEKKVWNFLIFGGIFFVFLINLLFSRENLLKICSSALVYGLFYYATKLTVKGKFGNADILFGIFQGICLSFIMLPVCVLIEVLLTLLILNKKLLQGYFPFIPFMSGGLIISYSLQLQL